MFQCHPHVNILQRQASTQHSTVGAGTSCMVLSGHPYGDSNDQAAAPGTRIYPHPPTFAHPILHPSSHSQGSSQQTPPSASAFEGVRVMHGATTNEEIRLFAATWLSGSRDREGGKKERQHARQLDTWE